MNQASIAALNVYPVKSCRGIATARARWTETGLAIDGARDREWMVVDARGRFVTQRERPKLALVTTRVGPHALELVVPERGAFALSAQGESREVTVWNAHVRGFDAGDEVADALGSFLRDPVRLVRFDDSQPRLCNPQYAGDSGATTLYSDGYPMLVVGQASLDDLNRRLAAHGDEAMPMNRFRPSIVVAGLEPYDEDHVDTLAFGDAVIKLVKPCVRCEITTTDQATARRGLEPLRTLSTYRRDDRLAGVTFGMNAILTRGAGTTVAIGDSGEAVFRF
jgi:uncharacterized protein YcbX